MPQFVGTIAAQADDGYATPDGSAFNTIADVEMNSNTNANIRRLAWFRVENVTIPNGQTIDAATFQVQPTGDIFDDANVTIHIATDDNVAAPTTNAEYLALTKTTASVDWVSDGLGTGVVTSPDIAAVVQEKVNQANWTSGDSMIFMVEGKTDVFKRFIVRNFGDPFQVFEVTIDHSAASLGGSAIPAIMHHRRLMGVS